MGKIYLRSHNVTPPGGYRYKHPEKESNGFISKGTTFGQLVNNAEAHRKNMGYPDDADLASTIDNAICESLAKEDRYEYCDVDATKDWPIFLLPMKLLAQPGDRGLGDIVARTIGPAGGDAYKEWFKETFDKECGCKSRQDRLNRRYSL